jgi:hypothetical protein
MVTLMIINGSAIAFWGDQPKSCRATRVRAALEVPLQNLKTTPNPLPMADAAVRAAEGGGVGMAQPVRLPSRRADDSRVVLVGDRAAGWRRLPTCGWEACTGRRQARTGRRQARVQGWKVVAQTLMAALLSTLGSAVASWTYSHTVPIWGQSDSIWAWIGLLDLIAGSRPAAWGLLARPNKGGILGFHLSSRWRSTGFPSSTIWLECLVPEGSVGKLHCGRIMNRVHWIRWDSVVRPCVFIWPFGFRGSVGKLYWLLPSYGTFSHPWWSQLAENVMEAKIWGPAVVVWILVARWNWLGDSCLGEAASKVRATTHVKSEFLPCGMKIQGLTLIGCAWQWPRWMHCFCEWGFSPGWRPKIYDQATMALAWELFPSWRHRFWRVGLLVLSWRC